MKQRIIEIPEECGNKKDENLTCPFLSLGFQYFHCGLLNKIIRDANIKNCIAVRVTVEERE